MNENTFFALKDLQKKMLIPFPYKDTEKLYNDFNHKFHCKECASFNADFDHYCAMIAGTLSYILNQKSEMIPKKQIEFIKRDFFETYTCYDFLKENLKKYNELNKAYLIHEEARKIILHFLAVV